MGHRPGRRDGRGLSRARQVTELDARGHLERALDDFLTPEQLRVLIDEVLKVTKRVSAVCTCKHCSKKSTVMVEVTDAKAVAGAIGDLLTQAKGRPGESREDASVTVNRKVYLVAEESGADNG